MILPFVSIHSVIFLRNFQQVILRIHSSFAILYAEIVGLQQRENMMRNASVIGNRQL